jgi:ABC-type branched-subunit amino acid transport system substrate-binding protein
VALTLVAASCGDRGDNDTSGGGGTDTTEAAAGGEGAGDFGDLAGVCGPAEGEVGPVGDDPAETQGVDEDSIKIGTVSDPGFEGRPGLNQEIFDAGEAFVAWCNEAGGINGRQVELTLYDAAITNYQPQIEAACENEFAIVGSGAVQDNLWPTVGVPCGLIDVAGFSVTPEKGGLVGRDPLEERTIQPVPNPADQIIMGAASLLAEEFPDAIGEGYMLNADLATLITQADKETQGLEQVGYSINDTATYAVLGEANWTPFASDIADAGTQMLRLVGEGENMALLQQALEEVGYTPELTFQGANFYDQSYIDASAGSAEGTFVQTVFNPFEEADEHPATQQYIDLVEAQGGKVALLGAQSMSGWLLFATAARDCDIAGTLTRTCVLETAAEVTDWTGGGLHAPTSPGTNEGSNCEMVLQIQGDEFVRHAPEEGFACDDAYLVDVEPGSS